MSEIKRPFPKGSINDTIWEALYYYPMLYHNGGGVLHHMFVCIGNGYEWQDGKLLYIMDRETDEGVDNIHENPTEHETIAPDHLRYGFIVDRLRRNAEADFVRTNAEVLVHDRYRPWQSIYPLSEYAAILTVPDDVQEDFLEAARLAIDLACGAVLFRGVIRFDSYKGRRSLVDKTEASIIYLNQALKSIIGRFGPDPLAVESNGYRCWTTFNEFAEFQRSFRADVREAFLEISKGWELI